MLTILTAFIGTNTWLLTQGIAVPHDPGDGVHCTCLALLACHSFGLSPPFTHAHNSPTLCSLQHDIQQSVSSSVVAFFCLFKLCVRSLTLPYTLVVRSPRLLPGSRFSTTPLSLCSRLTLSCDPLCVQARSCRCWSRRVYYIIA